MPKEVLQVGGITPFTTLDFPGKLAAVCFCQGCPYACPYCHNPHLRPFSASDLIPWPRITSFLTRRRGMLDGVVFSGGEPTIQPTLVSACEETRTMGFNVALHTAGSSPKTLAAVLPFVSWVGLDIKAPFDAYEQVTGAPRSGEKAKASLEILLSSGLPYECRTTFCEQALPPGEIIKVATQLAEMGVKDYALQVGRSIQGQRLASASNVRAVAQIMKKLFPNFLLRD